MAQHSNRVTVVIRSVGERTETLCHHLLAQQVPEQNIVTVRESPFTAAIAKTFEVGLARNLPWTLVIDADVLVHPEAVGQMLRLAEQADANAFEIQANVLDKFFCMPRPAGNHLYRTSLLDEAIRHIPPGEVSLRPETFLIKSMADQGYPWMQHEMVVGLHDYEQFYRDIYRKSFIQAHKHGRHIPYLAALWERLATGDTDYEVALKGLYAGLVYEGAVTIDSRLISQQQVDVRLRQNGWYEKDGLGTDSNIGSEIVNMIEAHTPPPEYPLYMKYRRASNRAVWIAQARTMADQSGWLKTVHWLAAKIRHRLTGSLGT